MNKEPKACWEIKGHLDHQEAHQKALQDCTALGLSGSKPDQSEAEAGVESEHHPPDHRVFGAVLLSEDLFEDQASLCIVESHLSNTGLALPGSQLDPPRNQAAGHLELLISRLYDQRAIVDDHGQDSIELGLPVYKKPKINLIGQTLANIFYQSQIVDLVLQ